MNQDNFAEVTQLIQAYFDGLYNTDSASLRQVFHPKLAYICASEGDELYLDLETYLARIDKREAPAKRGEPRKEVILDINFGSSRLAYVTARMTLKGRDFLDYLTLIREGKNWRIATKVFAYVPREE